MEVKEITVETLQEWRNTGKEHQLIDVRESYEIEIVEIQGQHIPLDELPNQLDTIRNDIDVVIHCRSGARSARAVQYIMSNRPEITKIYNLAGGILAWADKIDMSLEKY
ncbi:MAG: NADH oxidase [Saprospirales bacterium]|nr:NADH oxidase [Saprospirales bacterium]|tara:strand:+ start:1876 stop:2202 length:327 start_codon:yes stop_codon:yes gene_type:complete